MMAAHKPQSPKSRKADDKLSRWGDCQKQGELFTRQDLSKAAPAQVKGTSGKGSR